MKQKYINCTGYLLKRKELNRGELLLFYTAEFAKIPVFLRSANSNSPHLALRQFLHFFELSLTEKNGMYFPVSCKEKFSYSKIAHHWKVFQLACLNLSMQEEMFVNAAPDATIFNAFRTLCRLLEEPGSLSSKVQYNIRFLFFLFHRLGYGGLHNYPDLVAQIFPVCQVQWIADLLSTRQIDPDISDLETLECLLNICRFFQTVMDISNSFESILAELMNSGNVGFN